MKRSRLRKRSVRKTNGNKLWSITKSDDEFSLFIRKRDGKCLFPGCTVNDMKKLQCSHYHGRRHNGTRWHPDNCISLCWVHHFKDKLIGWEYAKQRAEKHGRDGEYTVFMKTWLGPERFAELDKRARTYPQSRAIIELMTLLGYL